MNSPSGPPWDISVVVPTMNESGNIRPLVKRLAAALSAYQAEILFVDDSRDETPQVIQALTQTADIPIRLLHRPPERRNGLSGAVVDGLLAAGGRWVCVMDGDLQHPPELLPEMMAAARRLDADMVVGSRRASVLGPQGLTLFRTLTSQSLTILARALFPRSLKDVSDPLTGFFLVRRDQVHIDRLRPEGFKILLEILVRCPDMRITELEFDFGDREQGESKADFREGVRFFRHLLTLRLTAHQRPMGKYLAISLLTFAADNGLVWLLAGRLGWGAYLGVVVAAELTDLLSFAAHRRFVFPPDGGERKFGRYLGLNQLFLFILRLPLFALFFAGLDVPLLPANVLAIGLATAARYMLSDRWIWTRDLLAHERPLAYYDIHGLVAIESPIPLPDLANFQVDRPPQQIDIRLRLDRHGTPRRTRDTIVYDEGLGRLGFAVTIYPLDGFAEVVASPLVQRSPAVLFSNIIEPLTRWLLLQQGVVMVQAGGTINEAGEVHLFTGHDRQEVIYRVAKRVAGGQRQQLFSPVQSLITRDGVVYPYLKPLTLRQAFRQPWLRRLGARLRGWGWPVATVYTLVQWLVPPRKGKIEVGEARQGRLKGLDIGRPVGIQEAAFILLENGRDPYGFPLLSLLASRDGVDVAQRELEIINAAASHVKD